MWCLEGRRIAHLLHATLVNMDNNTGQPSFVPWNHITVFFCITHKMRRLFQAEVPQGPCPVSSGTPHTCCSLSSHCHSVVAGEKVRVTAASLLSLGEKTSVFIFSSSSKTLFAPTVPGTHDLDSSMIWGFLMRQGMSLTVSSFSFPRCSKHPLEQKSPIILLLA